MEAGVYEYWTRVESRRTASGPPQHPVATLGKRPGWEAQVHAGGDAIDDLLEGRTPAKQRVKHYDLDVFFDKDGKAPMTDDKALELLGDGTGKIRFNFIFRARREDAVTADLVIIGQTVRDERAKRGQRRASPFLHPSRILTPGFYPTYYVPSPARQDDPTDLQYDLKCCADGYVLGRTLDVIEVPRSRPRGPYKYTIVALCEDATKVTEFDPCVIINPH